MNMLRRSSLKIPINGFRFYCSTTVAVKVKEESVLVIINRDGDCGKSKLLSGKIIEKHHPIFHALGHTDELLCHLGLARTYAKKGQHSYIEHIKRIQTILIDINSLISRSSVEKCPDLDKHIKELEDWMKMYSMKIPSADDPQEFLIPGGSEGASTLYISRSICRKSERAVSKLIADGLIHPDVLAYLNRLADFLLILARMASIFDQAPENIYIPKPSNTK